MFNNYKKIYKIKTKINYPPSAKSLPKTHYKLDNRNN